MDLDRVKQLMQQGVSYEKAYGFCMLKRLGRKTKYPTTKFKRHEGAVLISELCVPALALQTTQRLLRK